MWEHFHSIALSLKQVNSYVSGTRVLKTQGLLPLIKQRGTENMESKDLCQRLRVLTPGRHPPPHTCPAGVGLPGSQRGSSRSRLAWGSPWRPPPPIPHLLQFLTPFPPMPPCLLRGLYLPHPLILSPLTFCNSSAPSSCPSLPNALTPSHPLPFSGSYPLTSHPSPPQPLHPSLPSLIPHPSPPSSLTCSRQLTLFPCTLGPP